MADQARKAAYQTLRRIELDGAFSNLVTTSLQKLPPLDASFATALVMGTLEKKRALDFILARYVQRKPDAEVQILLRTGVLQILYMDRIPDRAACDQTVSIAHELFGAGRAGFVNAVLRALVRDQEQAKKALAAAEPAIRYSFSDGVASLLQTQYPQQAEPIMEAFSHRPPLHIRVNPLKGSAEELAERLHPQINGSIWTITEKQAQVVRSAQKGEYLIQGYGSQMAVQMLGARAGETVVDVCACPGGKSFGAALDMGNCGRVISMDIHANKLSLIRKGAKQLGITILQASVHDAREPDAELIGQADRVICDVPCSGLGVMASKPEIRYKDPAEFAGLSPTQRRILAASAQYLRRGGTLVYSTCTLNREENEAVVRDFVSTHPRFTLEEERTYFPFEPAGEGFYTARLVRNS